MRYHRLFDEAVRMVQEILEIDPNNLQSRWTLGEIYEGMFPQAIDQYRRGWRSPTERVYSVCVRRDGRPLPAATPIRRRKYFRR